MLTGEVMQRSSQWSRTNRTKVKSSLRESLMTEDHHRLRSLVTGDHQGKEGTKDVVKWWKSHHNGRRTMKWKLQVCGESAKSPQKMKNLKKQLHKGKCGEPSGRVSMEIGGISSLTSCGVLTRILCLRKHPIEPIGGSKLKNLMTEDHHRLRSLVTGDHQGK